NSPAAILRVAVETGLGAETIERLAALAWKQQDRDAAKEFAEALAAFQDECPNIRKAANAKIVTKSGGSYGFNYAKLEQIHPIVKPICSKHGLSYSWDSKVEQGMLTVTCTLRHVNGHRESASFSCPTSSSSGASDAQKFGMADTYARRHSLTAILGLTTTDEDTDGADPSTITPEQAATIRDMISAVGANENKFLLYMGVGEVEDIRASDYRRAVVALKAKGE
ncbi:MAG TPA: ERF family protein, partial [Planctomycetota bacterium]|nr:ERF family protein [Planctomycetota bacterium]